VTKKNSQWSKIVALSKKELVRQAA